MLFKNFFRELKLKLIAKQLRRPSGVIGRRTGEMMNKSNEILYDFTIRHMQVQPGDRILEIGFSNGKFFDKLFAVTAGISVAGLDYSTTMLTAALENNKTLIADGRLQLQPGSSDKIPFADNSFSVVFCINVIYFWENPVAHLREIYRVLKPCGRFYATVRTEENMLRLPFTKYGFTFYKPERWKKNLEEAGLQFYKEIRFEKPVIVEEGDMIDCDSICCVAEKMN